MPLEVKSVQPNSLAANNGIQPGDIIQSINGNEIMDFLDLQYHAADSFLRIELTRNKQNIVISITRSWDQILGLEPAVHKCKKCINDCIFCFVDQMKPGLRKSLYIKDDDYRLSFTFGNFITLTNLNKRDFSRISDLNLSPLYVSVHTTNPRLHKKMLRYYHNFNIMDALRKLSENNIEMHTQIVLVPNWNDGEQLQRTLDDLTSESVNVLSIGIVPVGISKFRKSLVKIETVSPSLALQTINLSLNYPRTYCADEIFLLAQSPLPPSEYYADFPQLENGIGMIRLMLENWKLNKAVFLEFIAKIPARINFITSMLAYEHLKMISDEINSELPEKTKVTRIRNFFFGETVTVCGLLTCEDIISQIEKKENYILAVSSSIFNDNGLTIDDINVKGLSKLTGKKILVVDEEFSDWKLYD